MHRRIHFLVAIAILPLASQASQGRAHWAATPVAAISTALQGTQASAVVLDERSGAILASVGAQRRDIRATPGSAIKPLWLAYALEHGIIHPQTEVYCRRKLKIGSRSLPCTHPADRDVFTAETALAESCNTWFAELGRRYTGIQMEAAIRAARLPHANFAQATTEQRQLEVLGLQGLSVSPLQLAQAYRDLLQRLTADSPVQRGLRGSVQYGMANLAAVPGLDILGKTGTASNPGEAWTHGWFAGALSGQYIVVIYVPRGDGGTAARLAHTFFLTIASQPRAR